MALILIADDVALARENAARVLRERGHKVITVADGQEAIDKFARERADVVVLDLMMPRVSGLDACMRIKASGGGFTPVLFISARADLDTRLSALAIGEDFLPKPYDLPELCARVDAHLRTRKLFEELRGRGGVSPESASAGTGESRVGTGDSGLVDRAAFLERVGEEWKRSTRTTDPMSLVVCGVDGPGGTGAIGPLAAALERCLRSIDVLCRSDERHVAGLLLNTHVTGVMSAVTRLRGDLRRLAIDGPGTTVSIGAAFHPSREVAEPADLLKLAERAIARAREEGPGRICFWQHAGYLFEPPDTA